MLHRRKRQHQIRECNYPRHPIISETLHRDTLDRVVDIIELLELLEISDGMTPKAHTGLYWIYVMLADAVKHVSDGLEEPASRL